MNISVLVPTYRRPTDLIRCLQALADQTRSADEVLVVVRDTDEMTQQALADLDPLPLPLRLLPITQPGQVAALNLGIHAASGDVVAITDDDATPHPDWVERIEAHFAADDQVGGVGGRDWVYLGPTLLDGASATVGKIQWFGRVIGNHHIGTGSARQVDVLKGANMSYRKAAIANLSFDERLRGQGAQVHNDLAFSTAVKRQGWKLVYDPAVAVNHYPAQRFDDDTREQFSAQAKRNAAHNETLILLSHLSLPKKLIYLIWGVLVGTRTYPGAGQYLRLFLAQKPYALAQFWATLQGRLEGCQTWISQLSNQEAVS